jgi:hypothetical protein
VRAMEVYSQLRDKEGPFFGSSIAAGAEKSSHNWCWSPASLNLGSESVARYLDSFLKAMLDRVLVRDLMR